MKKNKIIPIIFVIIILLTVTIAYIILIDVDDDDLKTLTELKLGTSFYNSDSDFDGINDGIEVNEYYSDPLDWDCDDDGLSDGEEIKSGTNIFDSDTDDDGYEDGIDANPTVHDWKLKDSDNDGLNDFEEYYYYHTDRFDRDTDGDNIKDGLDSYPLTHDWKLKDSDNDGWSDYREYYQENTDRYDSDTDGDGFIDSVDPNPLVSAEFITRHYEWDYPHNWWDKKSWTWEIPVPLDLYDYFTGLPRLYDYDYWSIYTVDPIVTELANALKTKAEEEGYNDYQTVSYILAFVQSISYTEDDVSTGMDEYPKYPTETLVDGGDCEDTSFLFASLVKELGFGVCLINPPNHLAVGVLGSEDLYGVFYELDGKRYYYCETTGSGWEIGECPDEYLNVKATLYRL